MAPLRSVAVAAGLLIAVLSVIPFLLREPKAVSPRWVENETIQGSRTLETEGVLVITDTEVQGSAMLTVRAGTSVVFGDGFSVESTGSMTVSTGPYDRR